MFLVRMFRIVPELHLLVKLRQTTSPEETTVLAKCANPTCSAPFRRLTEGKLFQVETQYPADDQRLSRKNRLTHHVEHYWLCSECARLVTLAFHEDRGIMTVPLAQGNFTRRVRMVEFNRRPAHPEHLDTGLGEEWASAREQRSRS
jgi:hypothetical protein